MSTNKFELDDAEFLSDSEDEQEVSPPKPKLEIPDFLQEESSIEQTEEPSSYEEPKKSVSFEEDEDNETESRNDMYSKMEDSTSSPEVLDYSESEESKSPEMKEFDFSSENSGFLSPELAVKDLELYKRVLYLEQRVQELEKIIKQSSTGPSQVPPKATPSKVVPSKVVPSKATPLKVVPLKVDPAPLKTESGRPSRATTELKIYQERTGVDGRIRNKICPPGFILNKETGLCDPVDNSLESSYVGDNDVVYNQDGTFFNPINNPKGKPYSKLCEACKFRNPASSRCKVVTCPTGKVCKEDNKCVGLSGEASSSNDLHNFTVSS